jgi:hypothetical protein
VPGAHVLLCVEGQAVDVGSVLRDEDHVMANVPGAQTTQTRSEVVLAAAA